MWREGGDVNWLEGEGGFEWHNAQSKWVDQGVGNRWAKPCGGEDLIKRQ